MYNYYDAMYGDIEKYFRDHVCLDDYRDEEGNLDKEALYGFEDTLWDEDSVTGKSSGSYTSNSYEAEEYLVGNWHLLLDALEEFGCMNINPIKKGAEWCDVTIRCCLLGEVLSDFVDSLD